MRRFLFLLPLAIAIAGCRPDVLSPRDRLGVSVRLVQNGLLVHNHSVVDIYYFTIEQHAAAAALWAPCTVPAQCQTIEANSSELVPFDRIAFWTPQARVALFYWWLLMPAENGALKPDSIRTISASR